MTSMPWPRTPRAATLGAAVLAVAAAIATGRALAADDFPAGASAPDAAAIGALLGGRIFDVQLAGGGRWRLEFKPDGYFFINASNGFNGSGPWRVEDGRLCTAVGRDPPACNDLRVHDGTPYLRRTNGEIVRLVAR